jgi:beta-galactosidase
VNRRTFHKLAGFAGLGAMLARRHAAFGLAWEVRSGPEKASTEIWDRYLLGSAYYPEWWPKEEWETDFRQMQELGLNTVRMGEFAWSRFEPAPGKFDFDWMDEAIELANRRDIRVILGTPTGSIPPWLYQLHPDVLSGNEIGPYTYGGRKGYCTSSENYLAACASVVTAMAEHYGKHRGVIGWQLDNEPGYPPQSYDAVTERAFQAWLQKRYGTLEALNSEWNGAFWSNEYTDWSQIRIPRNSAESGWQPAISLAYRRFFSDSFLNHLRRQAEILRRHCGNQFIFTNWPAPTWSVDVFAAAAEFLDATAWDNYVSAPGVGNFRRQYIAGFLSDFSRCAGPHQRFLCAEQNAYVPPNAKDEGLRLQAYSDLAHGSRGQLFFEWRRPLAGAEEHRPSFIKGFDGELNPAKNKLRQIAQELGRLGPLLSKATTVSEIALLYDFANEWAQGYGGIGDKNPRYNGECQAFYNGFKVLQRNIDVVPTSVDFTPYKLIVASNLRLVDDATAERLKRFVANGGTLVLNNRAGTQNTGNSMRLMLAPGPFTEMAGVHAEAMLDLVEYNTQNGFLDAAHLTELSFRFAGEEAVYHPRSIMESLILRGAEVLATVHGGEITGRPAVTRNRYQQGWAYYVGVDSVEDEFYEALARMVGTTCGLAPLIAAPYGVEVTSRHDEGNTYYFLLNLTETPHEKIDLPRPMNDLIKQRKQVMQISLGPLESAVLA